LGEENGAFLPRDFDPRPPLRGRGQQRPRPRHLGNPRPLQLRRGRRRHRLEHPRLGRKVTLKK